ncbi:MAG: 6-phosphogluconolactonase, partial [Candidatus Saccharimonadales bacterium]
VAGVDALARSLSDALSLHSRVLWLVPGGSNIALAVRVMQALSEQVTEKLHIMLTDERYGAVDHADSNFRQLREAGFDTLGAHFIPTLADGLSLDATAAAYAENFNREANDAGYIIAQFGIGPDGHIAGILPGSPASTSDSLAAGYHTEQFDRITLTFSALKRIDEAYVFAYGQAKKSTLEQLKNQSVSLIEQPAQILRQIPEATVYNDCIAEEATNI